MQMIEVLWHPDIISSLGRIHPDQNRRDVCASRGNAHFSKEIPFQMTPALDLVTISFAFNNIMASSRFSIKLFIFINIPGSILFHFLCSFVFIHIVGSTFIFNIFLLGQLPHHRERHMGEPPELAQAETFCLHEHRVFVVRNHQDGVILA